MPCKDREKRRLISLKANRAYRARHKDRLREKYRKFAEDNREFITEKNRLYYQKNRERIDEKARLRYAKAETDKVYHVSLLLRGIRARAKRMKIPFNLTNDDLVIPNFCPILGIPIKRYAGNTPNDNSISVDRIIPEKGYTKGNVIVISLRANRIKTNATSEDILKVGEYYKNMGV